MQTGLSITHLTKIATHHHDDDAHDIPLLPVNALVAFFVGIIQGLSRETTVACKCSDTSSYMVQSDHISTLRVCIYHTNVDAILLGLSDMSIAINNTSTTTLEDQPSFQVECSQNYCWMMMTMVDDDLGRFIDELDSSSLELSGRATVQEIINESTGQKGSHETSFLVSLSSDDDYCQFLVPENGIRVRSLKGAVIVMIVLVLVVIVCCFGARFRKTTASDIPL